MTDRQDIERDIETLTGAPIPPEGTREHLRYMQAVQNTRPDLADAYFALTRSSATPPVTAPPASLTRQLNLSQWRDRLEGWRSALLQRSNIAGKKVPDKRKFWIIAGSVGAFALVGFFAMSTTPAKKAEGPNLLGGVAGQDVRGKTGTTLAEPTGANAPASTRPPPSEDAAPASATVNAALALPAPLRQPRAAPQPQSSSVWDTPSPSQSDASTQPRYGVTSAPPYGGDGNAFAPANLNAPATTSATLGAAPNRSVGSAPRAFAAQTTRAGAASNAPTASIGRTVHVVPSSGATGAASPLGSPSLPPGAPGAAPGAPGSSSPATGFAAPSAAPSSAARASTHGTTGTVVASAPATASVSVSVPTPPALSASLRLATPTQSSANALPVAPSAASARTSSPSATVVPAGSASAATSFVRAGSGAGGLSVQAASPPAASTVGAARYTQIAPRPPPVANPSAASPEAAPIQPAIPVPAPAAVVAAPAPPAVASALGAPGLEQLVPGVALGARLSATMMTTVIAVESGTSPLVAQTVRDTCDAPPCAPILWIGEAFLGADKRVHARITRAVVGDREVAVRGQALGADLGPGIVGEIRDEAPTLVMDLLRGSISAFGDYLGAAVSQKTTTVISGGAVQSTNLPSLTDFFLGKVGQLFSLGANPSPTFVRVARVEQGASFTVLYGIDPPALAPNR